MEIALALVQMDISPLEPNTNMARMEVFIEQAKAEGAQLVVFPEDAVTGPLTGQTAFLHEAPGFLAHFQELAVKHGVDLVPGSWTVQEGAALYNTAHYINANGTIAGSYRKIHLWETEAVRLTPGSAVSVFPTAHGMVGLTICWDLAFPELFTEMTRRGAELVVSPTYWSFTLEAEQRRDVENDEILLIDSLCVTRAFESDILFAYCNAAGELMHDGVEAVLSGRSQVTHPSERVLGKARANAEELVFVRATHTKAAAVEPQ